MRSERNSLFLHRTLAIVSLAASLFAGAARADDAQSQSGGQADTSSATPPDGGTPMLGPIERMPPSAFPTDRVRGIYGGSLWSIFHGMQWPYYPKTGIGVSGYVWIDSGYEHISRQNPTEQGTRYWLQQGRLLLRITPTWTTSGGYFVQGQAEFVANKDQSQAQPNIGDTDDIWVRAGKWKSFDVQLGRYEGWEIYHFGMGLDLYTLERNGATDTVYGVPQIYGVTYAFYRPAGVGQAAVHVYPTDYLRFELGTQFGNEFGQNTLAARPVGVLDLGYLKIKAGAEYKKLTDQADNGQDEKTERGLGVAIQTVIDPYFEVGVNGAYGLVDHVSQDGTVDQKGSFTTYSVGGFANARIVTDLLVGAGIDYTYLEDTHFDPMLGRNQIFKHTQTFLAVQYLLAKHLFIKAVAAYARGYFAPNFGSLVYSDEMLSARLRLQYLF
jgi:hypothetical protein